MAGGGGKELDQETGSGGWAPLNYFGARYLHSATGRFTSVDPVLPADLALLNPQRWNRYTYVMNRPLVVTDPDGRCPLCPTMQRLGQVTSNFASRYGTPLYNWAARFFNSSAGQDAVELAADAFGLSGNIGRLSTWEKQTGARLAKQMGEVLEVAEHVGSEFVTAAGKTIDAMGVPHAYGRFWNWNQFSLSIRKHLSKSNDHTVIDLTGASPEQIAQIQEYVESLGKDAVEHFLYVRD